MLPSYEHEWYFGTHPPPSLYYFLLMTADVIEQLAAEMLFMRLDEVTVSPPCPPP